MTSSRRQGAQPMNVLPDHGQFRKLLSVLRDEWRVRVCLYVTWYAVLAWAHATLRRKELQRQSGKSLQIGTFWRA